MYILNYIETNPFLLGICALINSFGVRLLWDDLNDYDKNWLYHSYFKKIVIFTILLITTKDILITIIVFLLYLITFQPEFFDKLLNKKYYQNKDNNSLFN
jgi:hypothetical protein